MKSWPRLIYRVAVGILAILACADDALGSLGPVPPSLVERLATSQLVVAGTIGKVATQRNPRTGAVFSLCYLEQVVPLRPKRISAPVTVRKYGGAFEGQYYEIAGAAELVEGERYIFLLNPRRDDPAVFELAYDRASLFHVLGSDRLVFDYSWHPVLDVNSKGLVLGKGERATRDTPWPRKAIFNEMGGLGPPKAPLKSGAVSEERVLSRFQQLLDARERQRE